MRDLAVLLIVAALAGAAFWRPWLGVLGLAAVGYLQPHAYATGLARAFPAYEAVVAATVAGGGLAAWRGRLRLAPVPRDWRLVAFVLLWAYFLLTTVHAKVEWLAWPRFYEVSKTFVALALTVALIDTRRKLLCLVATIAASIALVTVKGGYWAFIHGFADRVYGPPGSHFYDNNHFAVLVLMNVPLLLLWRRAGADRRLGWLLAAVVGLSLAAVLSSWSRGGLLALGATVCALIWFERRRLAGVAVGLACAGLAFAQLPEAWMARMGSIAAFGEQHSAQSRLEVWRSGVDYALAHPLLGAGFEGWRFVNVNVNPIDWHNAYVEVMAEHGLVALALWLSLLAGSIVMLGRLAARGRADPALAWARDPAAMLATALLAYAAGAMFVGISQWDIWYHLVAVAIVLRRLAGEVAPPPAPAAREALVPAAGG